MLEGIFFQNEYEFIRSTRPTVATRSDVNPHCNAKFSDMIYAQYCGYDLVSVIQCVDTIQDIK